VNVHAASTYARRGLSKAVFVYEDLRDAIIRLELKPGAPIDKHEVCARLGISRQPLAEAIARLADERLLDVAPHKGTFVARIRLEDVAEAAFVRRSLEVAAVEAIATDIDETTLNRLDRILGYQAAALKAEDIDEFYAFDLRFHSMLFERLAMRRVSELVETARAPLERARRLLLPKPGRSQNTIREHRSIFMALAARSPARAGDAMGKHLDEVMVELRVFADSQPQLFEQRSQESDPQ
jgi:GntR family transcriptional regulator, rspAB operon transcriptional repressor